MKIPIVKEHGSWVVFILSCFAGVFTGISSPDFQTGRDFSIEIAFTISGLALLINSKKPLSSIFKSSKSDRRMHLFWFAFFSISGCILLIPFLIDGFTPFLIFSPLILSYLILLSIKKEHHLITELIGFALLCLSAPIIYFVVTGELSFRLYLAVFIFFAAGVLKVRVMVRKTLLYRWTMFIYCLSAVLIFLYIDISTIMLLPLVENIITALWIREEKLKTTGNIELIKGAAFTLLLIFFGSKSIV